MIYSQDSLCELKPEEQEGTSLGKIQRVGLAGSSNGKGLSGECCRKERRLVQRDQAFWATPRTSAFTLCEVEAMEGFRKKRDLAGLWRCRREGGKHGSRDPWGGYCNSPGKGAGAGIQVVAADGGPVVKFWIHLYIF